MNLYIIIVYHWVITELALVSLSLLHMSPSPASPQDDNHGVVNVDNLMKNVFIF